MPETDIAPRRSGEERGPSPKADILWMSCSTSSEVAVGVVLNRYSSQMPLLAVFGICLIPFLLLLVVIVRHEMRRGWISRNFRQHPVSISILLVIFVPFFWYSTGVLFQKLQHPQAGVAVIISPPPVTKNQIEGPPRKISPTQPKRGHERNQRRTSNPAPDTPAAPVASNTAQSPPVQPTFNIQGNTGNVAGINNGQQTYISGDADFLHSATLKITLDVPTKPQETTQEATSVGLWCGVAMWDSSGRRYRWKSDGTYQDFQPFQKIHRFAITYTPVDEDDLLGRRVQTFDSIQRIGMDCADFLNAAGSREGLLSKNGEVADVTMEVRVNGIEVAVLRKVVMMEYLISSSDSKPLIADVAPDFALINSRYEEAIARNSK